MKKATENILSVVHETTKGLHKAGVLDELTMREFDNLCLKKLGTEPLFLS